MQVDDKLNSKIAQVEKDSDALGKQVELAVEQIDTEMTDLPKAKPGLESSMKEVLVINHELKAEELVERKGIKDFIRDQAKYDIDFLKGALTATDKSGSISRLTAMKRAICVVEPPEVEYQRHF